MAQAFLQPVKLSVKIDHQNQTLDCQSQASLRVLGFVALVISSSSNGLPHSHYQNLFFPKSTAVTFRPSFSPVLLHLTTSLHLSFPIPGAPQVATTITLYYNLLFTLSHLTGGEDQENYAILILYNPVFCTLHVVINVCRFKGWVMVIGIFSFLFSILRIGLMRFSIFYLYNQSPNMRKSID